MRYKITNLTNNTVLYEGNNKNMAYQLYNDNRPFANLLFEKPSEYEEYLEEQGTLPDTRQVLVLIRNIYEDLCDMENPNNAEDFLEEIEIALKRDYCRR